MGTKKKRIIVTVVIVASLLVAGSAYLGWLYWKEQQVPAGPVEQAEVSEPVVNPEIDYDQINMLADEINAARGEQ